MSWLINIGVWGARCGETFGDETLPALKAAIKYAGSDVRFLIHTDRAVLLRPAMSGFQVEFRPVPPGRTAHDSLGACQREAIAAGRLGETVGFICADMIVSIECFAAAERQIKQGKRLVMNAATRTNGGRAPIGARSRELLDWTMQHKHPIIDQCFWGGRTTVPWALYFQRGENIVLHAFHLHPWAAVKDREITFTGTTADFDIAASYQRAEIHVVSDPDEMSMAELSPLDRMFPNRPEPITVESVGAWAANHAVDVHRWFFRECPIVIQGVNDCGEHDIVEGIINAAMASGVVRTTRHRRR